MNDSPTAITATRNGPYTAGYFASCTDHSWTSLERETASEAMVDLGKHLRADHAPRPKDA